MHVADVASARPDPGFWSGKRVLLTGHTGFKGGWAAIWLARMGAEVTGVGLAPEPGPSLFALAGIAGISDSHIADIRDPDSMARIVRDARPDLVMHMAAQPLVRRSIRDPQETWSTNVTGTGVLLDAIRAHAPGAPVLVITSDKVYANDNSGRAFAEGDRLGGKDPYSASKAACELLVASHRTTYFDPAGTPLATVRGGNVIGGGDFSEDRLIPDIVRATLAGETLVLRHPEATRPWQHVLDCLSGYLVFLQALAEDASAPRVLNIGPDVRAGEATVAEAAGVMLELLGGPSWRHEPVPGSIEALALQIDPGHAAETIGWRPRLQGRPALDWTAEWYAGWRDGQDPATLATDQIARFEAL
jgi:CDP-glucose 4,6-dehydratase